MTGFRKAPLSLATWTILSLNLSARDKLVKIIQYVARILMWYYQRIKADDKILETIQKVKDVTSLSRRSFRMFRSIVHVNRIYNTVSNLIDDKCDTLLDDVLINSVGILEDFLLVLYFGYENYLFFVSTKILKIKSETETVLRNSSSLVSLVGNVARILGVCLRINRCAHTSNRKRRRLDLFLKKKKLLEKTIHDEDRKNDVPIYNEIFASSIILNKVSSKGNLRDFSLPDRRTHVLDLDCIVTNIRQQNAGGGEGEEGEEGDGEEEEEGSSEDYSLLTQEMDNTEVLTPDIIAEDFDMNYAESSHITISDCSDPKKKLHSNNKHEKKSANEKKLENENRRRTLMSYTEEGHRLEEDLNHSEEERRTLCSDAVVVTLELLISANYRPFCLWERLSGFKLINEGHEGIVGLISSFYVLNNIWPVVRNC